MKNYNIHINRNLPQDSEIEKHKDFDKLLAMYQAEAGKPSDANDTPLQPTSPKPAPLSLHKGLWLSAIVACLFVGIVGIYYFSPSSNDKVEPSTNTNQAITVPNTESALPEKTEISPKIVAEGNKSIEKASPILPKQKEEKVVVNPKMLVTEKPVQIVEKQAESSTVTMDAPKKATKKPFRLALENEDKFPELKNYQNYQWEYAGEEADKDPWQNNIFGKENKWSGAKIAKNGDIYEITLSRKDGTSFSFPVRMVFAGKAYEEAMEKYKEGIKSKE